MTPTASSSAMTRASSTGSPASVRARRRLSRTVSAPTRCRRCGTSPTVRPRQRSRAPSESATTSVPLTITDPTVGVVRPASICRTVVLPLPDCPASSQASPAPARHSGTSTAVTAP
jgi:hypothetical protein